MPKKLGLFEGYGIELEYMIVRADSLDVLPVSDEVLRSGAGRYVTDFDAGPVGWSNELVLHLLELKSNGPVKTFTGLAGLFRAHTACINSILEPLGGRLMPAGMHPWMDPAKETRLWRRRYRKIYQTYDRIFNCSRHGWANVQSVHLNLPFRGDEEFGRLHAAVRLLLPILPALAASSPAEEGRLSGFMDTRLFHYGKNQMRIPSISGKIIPEPVYSREGYERRILGKMYADTAVEDSGGVLRHEWLNSRGAIPRFDRDTIEIRLLDVQECARADLAIAGLIIETLKSLVWERWSSFQEQSVWKVDRLLSILEGTIRRGERFVVRDRAYLRTLGLSGRSARAGDVWRFLAESATTGDSLLETEHRQSLQVILEHGTLARRILRAVGRRPSKERLRSVYGRLCGCLADGEMFLE